MTNRTDIRPYKVCEPLSTVNRIRGLLEKCGLFTAEMYCYGLPADVACCRVFTGDEDMLSFGVGTNGKGMTMRYALASAYGEFMERLQNGVLFPNRQLKFAPELFRFGPDEEKKTVTGIYADCGDIIDEVFHFLPSGNALDILKQAVGEDTLLCAPFADIFKGRIRMMPVELFYHFTGTNGMSSGNTPAEAITHGICEIMERYAMRMIYMSRLTPPVIPEVLFDGTEVISRLRSLKKEGYSFEIRDCSLGCGLPVIGLLLRNPEGAFTFHLGSDLRAEIALERCLTEIFQGNETDISERFTSVTLEKPQTRSEKAEYCRQFCDATVRGTAPWPSSLLGPEPSYPFRQLTEGGENDKQDLRILIRLLKSTGHQLYIRDVGYLGFPSFYIYIPRMSELDLIYDDGKDLTATLRLARLQNVFISPRSSTEQQRIDLVHSALQLLHESISAPLLPAGLFLLNKLRLTRIMDDRLATALFAGSCGLYKEAGLLMDEYLINSDSTEMRKLFLALSCLWKEKAKKTPDADIRHLIKCLFGEKTANICTQSGSGKAVFDLFNWPECFGCSDCIQKKNCRFEQLVRVLTPIQQIFSQNIPDQSGILSFITRL